jgi:protein TonB
MIPVNDIFSSGWTSIVFAGRNQAYGAYQLRKTSNKAVLTACLITTALFSGSASFALYKVNQHDAGIDNMITYISDDRVLDKVPVDIELPLPVIETPPPLPQAQTTAYTVPVIVEDFTVIPDEVLDQTVLKDLNTGGANTDGDPTLTTSVEDVRVSSANTTEMASTETFMIVEQMPEYPGGMNELMKYIASNTVYPSIARENDIYGIVFVSFVVNSDGKVVDVKLAKGVDRYLDKEAVRVVSTLPAWKPGKQNGKTVRVKYTIPMKFELPR